jgi:hypothetical protein
MVSTSWHQLSDEVKHLRAQRAGSASCHTIAPALESPFPEGGAYQAAIEPCSRPARGAAKTSGSREATRHLSGAAASGPVLSEDAFRAVRGGPHLMKVRLIALASALMALFHVAGANFKY